MTQGRPANERIPERHGALLAKLNRFGDDRLRDRKDYGCLEKLLKELPLCLCEGVVPRVSTLLTADTDGASRAMNVRSAACCGRLA